MIYGLHGEIKCHKFADRPQSIEGCTNRQPCKPHLGDRGVDDPFIAVLLPQPSRNLKVCSFVSFALRDNFGGYELKDNN